MFKVTDRNVYSQNFDFERRCIHVRATFDAVLFKVFDFCVPLHRFCTFVKLKTPPNICLNSVKIVNFFLS